MHCYSSFLRHKVHPGVGGFEVDCDQEKVPDASLNALCCYKVFHNSKYGQCEGKYGRRDDEVVPVAGLVTLFQEICCREEWIYK